MLRNRSFWPSRSATAAPTGAQLTPSMERSIVTSAAPARPPKMACSIVRVGMADADAGFAVRAAECALSNCRAADATLCAHVTIHGVSRYATRGFVSASWSARKHARLCRNARPCSVSAAAAAILLANRSCSICTRVSASHTPASYRTADGSALNDDEYSILW